MSDGWLSTDKYEHMPVLGCTGPGTMAEGYSWKFVLHSTESPPGSIEGINALFRSKPCYAPHITLDPGSQRRVQMIPWTWSACALKGGRNGTETNRGRAIQMEVCGYAAESPDWDDDTLWQIADVIADVIIDGAPIDSRQVSDMRQLSGVLAREDAPQRMSPADWRYFPGITAHVEVIYQDHWDAGRVNSLRVSDMVGLILVGGGRELGPPAAWGGPPAPTNVAIDYLAVGMTGGIVMWTQQMVAGLGYDLGPGGADGVFGPATEAAVMALQADHGLVVDGIVGPQTNAVIAQMYAPFVAVPPPPPAMPGDPPWPGRYLLLTAPLMHGDDVLQWQAQMTSRGWHLDVDGVYGPESLTVCKSFQAEKGLEIDGVVGPATWAAAWTAPVT